ncbi:MAG: acylneuraminate cytidylyltransferase family protein [Candidatus Marinimicrobia bacterium]|jgi:CMP-N-acetylneuraminic acid synthetase|nr:acylneuraminate cytidylyltransferase family protein [Candidatus Neomarinimicrobiota bacterium]
MRIFAFIFARGGSKGVPGKNIKKISGKPLIAYSIEIAQEIESIDKIFVSTEDDNIANVATEHGADIIPRPHSLAKDNTPEWLAWQHAIQWLEEKGESFDIFISLPTTSPLRNKKDIIQCLKSFDKKTDVVVGVTEAARSPYFNMVRKDYNGFLKVLMGDDNTYTRRQETPAIFDMTTVAYVSRPEFITNSTGIFEGKIKGVEIPAERGWDIDTELDFEIAEFLMDKVLKLNKDEVNVK